MLFFTDHESIRLLPDFFRAMTLDSYLTESCIILQIDIRAPVITGSQVGSIC